MTKISPMAAYLTANKARTIKDGNIKRFVSPEGLYLGCQIKSEQNGATAYSIELYDGFKKMFFQSTVVGQKLAYVADKDAPLGVTLVPTHTYVFKAILDFINNKCLNSQYTRILKNDMNLLAMDEQYGVGLFDTDKPYIYQENYGSSKISPLKKTIIKYHFDKQ